MYLKIFFLSAAILGISQGGVTKGKYETFKGRGMEAQNPYLMGGYVIESRIYQSMVSIWYHGEPVCGGVILTEMWILTAAQCLENRNPYSIIAVFGSNKLLNGENVAIANKILHQYYDPDDSWRNDIALLRAGGEPSWDLRGLNVTVADSSDCNKTYKPFNLHVYSEQFCAGIENWEGICDAGGELSSDLQGLNVTVADSSDCNKAYNPFNLHVYSEQFCAGIENWEGTCDGDMGGPLFIDKKVMGIVSWGRPCGYSGCIAGKDLEAENADLKKSLAEMEKISACKGMLLQTKEEDIFPMEERFPSFEETFNKKFIYPIERPKRSKI
ncbi:hypothetical protein J437_LFUL009262 [Ladona fulva]|uniref:Peptidase S1 domain-containing protein n=1 Tax=Ladona fulva TaxID=123851 RepID=A0A8K0KJF7_LADFU|nr:hypothetical protein J437_LFUL009262 [Ladona fulva]